ncbi:MAG: hypothetical protein J0651_03040, partial [Actinobacteria bacterium]|nr:hypothetical protein [Actinomycetota bacterium]
QYLASAKKLNQLRNSLTYSINGLPGLKKKINSYMDENREYDEVLAEVLYPLTPAKKKKLMETIESNGSGFSNLAQFYHTMWTSFWKIRDGNRSLGVITAQTIRLLGIVPQLLEFPRIVVELSNHNDLNWFAERRGSLPEFFGVRSDSCLLEDLIDKLKRTQEVARSIIHQEKESQTATRAVGTRESVSELPGDGGGGGSGESALEMPAALEYEGYSEILEVISLEQLLDSQKTKKLTEILGSADVRIVQCFSDLANWNQSSGRFEGAPDWGRLKKALFRLCDEHQGQKQIDRTMMGAAQGEGTMDEMKAKLARNATEQDSVRRDLNAHKTSIWQVKRIAWLEQELANLKRIAPKDGGENARARVAELTAASEALGVMEKQWGRGEKNKARPDQEAHQH